MGIMPSMRDWLASGFAVSAITIGALGLVHLGLLMEYTNGEALVVGAAIWLFGVPLALVTIRTPAVGLIVLAAVPVGMWTSGIFDPMSVFLVAVGLLFMWPVVRLVGLQ